jgi:hypothetical protein
MVYTRSSKRNAFKIIENLEFQNIQLQKENNKLDKKNRVLEEEKIKLIKKYEPTNHKRAVNLILDLLLKFPKLYHEDTYSIQQNIYQSIVNNLCDNYCDITGFWKTAALGTRTTLSDDPNYCLEELINGKIFKKFTELHNKFIATKTKY